MESKPCALFIKIEAWGYVEIRSYLRVQNILRGKKKMGILGKEFPVAISFTRCSRRLGTEAILLEGTSEAQQYRPFVWIIGSFLSL